MIAQLPLELGATPSYARDDLVLGSANAIAIGLIDQFPNWPNPITVLVGGKGTGKTHIASYWQSAIGAMKLAANFIQSDIPPSGHVLIEDIDETQFDETALFHLCNHVRQNGDFLLITAKTAPSTWGVELPDLASRLRAANNVQIDAPDDELLTGVLIKLLSDRQMQIDANMVEYTIARIERSLSAINEFVENLDRLSLATGKKPSRHLASQLLKT